MEARTPVPMLFFSTVHVSAGTAVSRQPWHNGEETGAFEMVGMA